MLGKVVSLPQGNEEYTRFRFQPTDRQAELAGLPSLILVRWYRPAEIPIPGEFWQLRLRLLSPRGLVNFQGFDRERTLFASGVGALATVLDGTLMNAGSGHFSAGAWRARLREDIRVALPPGEARALVLSLLLADRSELSSDTWSLLRDTGTGHLLAISGMHIGLAAVFGFWLTRLVLLPVGFSFGTSGRSFTGCCIGAVVVAICYGFLAGFPVSTLRALIMLGLATWFIRTSRMVAPIQVWLAALILVLVIEPLAFLTAGFWLSFAAVFGLTLYFSPRKTTESKWLALPRAQVAVMAVTLPLSAFWFQSGSVLALPSNLFAIPWVSFISVPLVLSSVIALPSQWLFDALLTAAEWSCAGLLVVLKFISNAGSDWVSLTSHISPLQLLVVLAGSLILLLPAGISIRWLGLCVLCTLFLPRAPGLERGEYSIETLDVGQGLAVIVRTRNHMLLYDTGPGDGRDWSLAGSVIAPAIASKGHGLPGMMIVSHADLDHAGGLADLRKRYSETELLFNREEQGLTINGCNQDHSWTWDDVSFRVLHPSKWLPYRGNDSSCVISIENGRHKSLLTGDISEAVESRLTSSLNQYSFITVPHHGSTTSSSQSFLESVRPGLATVSAAKGNRFNFPREEVLQKYRDLEAGVFSTSECGAVRIEFPNHDIPRVSVARNQGFRPWRINANSAECMVRPDWAMYHLQRPKLKE